MASPAQFEDEKHATTQNEVEFKMELVPDDKKNPNLLRIQLAEIVIPCPKTLDETLEFFTTRLGFCVHTISPADDPSVVVVNGYEMRLRLERDNTTDHPGTLRLLCRNPDPDAFGGKRSILAPNGTRIVIVHVDPPLVIPPLKESFVLSRLKDAKWGVGRAGMRYRDLIPGRLGGRFVASHIHIPDGGLVPDYVHFHKVLFQMIYCYKGWVLLVYEDQGPPFVMKAGECVLQPPEIRHRVLEASKDLEVVEIGCPAIHDTIHDQGMELPTKTYLPKRLFFGGKEKGQTFVRHELDKAKWIKGFLDGFQFSDFGFFDATGGIAVVCVARRVPDPSPSPEIPHQIGHHEGNFMFLFVLTGSFTLYTPTTKETTQILGPGDSVTIPSHMRYAFTECTDDFTVLLVALPGNFKFVC